MDKKEICELLERGIVYANHTINDLNEHIRFTAAHKKVIGEIESYIDKCQQIIDANSKVL